MSVRPRRPTAARDPRATATRARDGSMMLSSRARDWLTRAANGGMMCWCDTGPEPARDVLHRPQRLLPHLGRHPGAHSHAPVRRSVLSLVLSPCPRQHTRGCVSRARLRPDRRSNRVCGRSAAGHRGGSGAGGRHGRSGARGWCARRRDATLVAAAGCGMRRDVDGVGVRRSRRRAAVVCRRDHGGRRGRVLSLFVLALSFVVSVSLSHVFLLFPFAVSSGEYFTYSYGLVFLNRLGGMVISGGFLLLFKVTSKGVCVSSSSSSDEETSLSRRQKKKPLSRRRVLLWSR